MLEEFNIPEGTEFLIMPSDGEPQGLIPALKEYFEQTEEVRAAYLVTFFLLETSQKSRIVLLDLEGHLHSVMPQLESAIEGRYISRVPVHFLEISDGGLVAEEDLDHIEPFYVRK